MLFGSIHLLSLLDSLSRTDAPNKLQVCIRKLITVTNDERGQDQKRTHRVMTRTQQLSLHHPISHLISTRVGIIWRMNHPLHYFLFPEDGVRMGESAGNVEGPRAFALRALNFTTHLLEERLSTGSAVLLRDKGVSRVEGIALRLL